MGHNKEPDAVMKCLKWWLTHPTQSVIIMLVICPLTLLASNAVYAYAAARAPEDPVLIPPAPRIKFTVPGHSELILHYALNYSGTCLREGHYSLRPEVPFLEEPEYWPEPGFQNGVDSGDPGPNYWVHLVLPPGIRPGTWFLSLRIHYTCPWNFWVKPLVHPLLLLSWDSNVPVAVVEIPDDFAR
jgi:hypothetical protein